MVLTLCLWLFLAVNFTSVLKYLNIKWQLTLQGIYHFKNWYANYDEIFQTVLV